MTRSACILSTVVITKRLRSPEKDAVVAQVTSGFRLQYMTLDPRFTGRREDLGSFRLDLLLVNKCSFAYS